MKVDPLKHAKEVFSRTLDDMVKVQKAKVLDPRITIPMVNTFKAALKTGFKGGEFIKLVGQLKSIVKMAQDYVSPVKGRGHDNQFWSGSIHRMIIRLRREGLSDSYIDSISGKVKARYGTTNDQWRAIVNTMLYKYEAARTHSELAHLIPDQASPFKLVPPITLPSLLPRVPHVNTFKPTTRTPPPYVGPGMLPIDEQRELDPPIQVASSAVISTGGRMPTPTKKEGNMLMPLLLIGSLFFMG